MQDGWSRVDTSRFLDGSGSAFHLQGALRLLQGSRLASHWELGLDSGVRSSCHHSSSALDLQEAQEPFIFLGLHFSLDAWPRRAVHESRDANSGKVDCREQTETEHHPRTVGACRRKEQAVSPEDLGSLKMDPRVVRSTSL